MDLTLKISRKLASRQGTFEITFQMSETTLEKNAKTPERRQNYVRKSIEFKVEGTMTATVKNELYTLSDLVPFCSLLPVCSRSTNIERS